MSRGGGRVGSATGNMTGAIAGRSSVGSSNGAMSGRFCSIKADVLASLSFSANIWRPHCDEERTTMSKRPFRATTA